MQAAVVDTFSAPPRFGQFLNPEPGPGEVLIRVRAAALSNLVRAQAAGKHYSSGNELPLVPGNDGVGTLPDGSRVYFLFPRAPFGSMAEYTAVQKDRTIPIPETLDDATAAALANPGMASWGALLGRARFHSGESVLINGATGVAGQQAVQAAKLLGASRIIATGRNQQTLEELLTLGATETIALTDDDAETQQRLQATLATSKPDVVLDYLWGSSALSILKSLAGKGAVYGEPRIRFIQIGSASGEEIALPAHLLRSSGIELLGSGLGSLSLKEILSALEVQYRHAASGQLTIDTELLPLAQVADAWSHKESGTRTVLTL